MTPRLFMKMRWAAIVLIAGASLIAITGCDPRSLAYFLQPFDPTIEPKGPVARREESRHSVQRDLGRAGRIPVA